MKEPTLESLTKKRKEYMPPKFMSVSEASKQILEIVNKKKDSDFSAVVSKDSLAIGLARVGSENQAIIACSLSEMANYDLGAPLHSLVIPAKQLHPLEAEFLEQFKSK